MSEREALIRHLQALAGAALITWRTTPIYRWTERSEAKQAFLAAKAKYERARAEEPR